MLFASERQIVPLLLGLLNSTIIFVRKVLVLERYTRPVQAYQIVAYLLSVGSGITFWATINAVAASVLWQLCLGICSTTLSWCVLVLLVNADFAYPSRMQWTSLVFYTLTEVSIVLQIRLILQVPPAETE